MRRVGGDNRSDADIQQQEKIKVLVLRGNQVKRRNTHPVSEGDLIKIRQPAAQNIICIIFFDFPLIASVPYSD
jgi:hypothetical protein